MTNTELNAPQDDAHGQAVAKDSWFQWFNKYFPTDWNNSSNRETKADRFDGFIVSNDGSRQYYDKRIKPLCNNTRACVTVEAAVFHEIAHDAEMIYVPCGISSGLRMHELLVSKNSSRGKDDKEWDESTYKSDERLSGDRVKQAIAQNRDDNLRRAGIIGRLYPDKMVIAPVVREGAVRAFSDRSFARGQGYEEEDFMAFWYPVIDRCKMMVLDGDWNFSRNSIWEMMRGVLIQAGQLESRPDADMNVVDLDGNAVTLLTRAEKIAQMLKYQLGKGFEPREAATALAQIFTLDDMIRRGEIPAAGRSVHSVLKDRTPEELAAMDALKAELMPILEKKCACYMRLDDLPDFYKDAAKKYPMPAKHRIVNAFKTFAQQISDSKNKICSVLVSPALRAKDANIDALPGRQFDSYERFFEGRAQSLMFEDNRYDKLQEWEKLAVTFAIGASETGLYPTGHPMATMVLADMSRGEQGMLRAGARGAANPNEWKGVFGRDIAQLQEANEREAQTLQDHIQAERPDDIVVGSASFKRISDVIDTMRPNFIAANGATHTSPEMRLALQMKYLDRNVGRAVFQNGWVHSNDLVQLRVRARLIQAGMIERPSGDQSRLEVFGFDTPDQPDTLLDDMKTLTQEVRRLSKIGDANATEPAVALARLVALHEMIVDPSLRKEGDAQTRDPINMQAAPPSLVSYDREEAGRVAEEARQLLRSKAALWIPHGRLHVKPNPNDDGDHAAAKDIQNRLMDGYLSAQTTLRGQQKIDNQPRTRSDIIINHHGTGTGR